MISFKDKTFCTFPDGKNACGSKMTDEEKKELAKYPNMPVCYGYFCGKK